MTSEHLPVAPRCPKDPGRWCSVWLTVSQAGNFSSCFVAYPSSVDGLLTCSSRTINSQVHSDTMTVILCMSRKIFGGMKIGHPGGWPIAADYGPNRTYSLIRTVTEPLPLLISTARSALPSPLKSPAAIAVGVGPVERDGAGVNVPLPLPRRMVTVLLP